MKGMLTFVVLILLAASASSSGGQRRPSPVEITSLKQAISDEIYDYGFYKDFDHIGRNIGNQDHWIAQIHLYIDPAYSSQDKSGKVIYKLMPFGQIYRYYFVEKGGGITLDGNPQNRFPLTQPSHQTVYMDEEDVLNDERSWIKATFTIDTQPTIETLKAASERQKKRTGFSDREYRQMDKGGQKQQ